MSLSHLDYMCALFHDTDNTRNKDLQVMAYPITGALLGSCLGGSVGLLAVLKFGGLAAIGGGFLEFTGGAILKMKCVVDRRLAQIEDPTELKSIRNSREESNRSQNKNDL